jgi:hypothetical protein
MQSSTEMAAMRAGKQFGNVESLDPQRLVKIQQSLWMCKEALLLRHEVM